jgi:hypothetical protein
LGSTIVSLIIFTIVLLSALAAPTNYLLKMAAHSFGPTCCYYEPENTSDNEGPPKVNAQFFYISSVPIDDPLSPVPPAVSEKASTKHPPQPFSSRDNAALEEAFMSFQSVVEPAKDAKIPRAKTQRMVSFPKFSSALKSKANIGSEHANRPSDLLSTADPSKNFDTPSTPDVSGNGSLKKFNTAEEAALKSPYHKLPRPPSPDSGGSKISDALSQGVANEANNPKEQNEQKEPFATKLKNMKHKQAPMSLSASRADPSKLGAGEVEHPQYQPPPGKPPVSPTEMGRKKNWFSSEASEPEVMLSQDSKSDAGATSPVGTEELRVAERETSPNSKSRRSLSPFKHLREKYSKDTEKDLQGARVNDEDFSKGNKHGSKHNKLSNTQGDAAADSDTSSAKHSGPDASSSMSGRPFARAPSKRQLSKIAMDGSADSDAFGEDLETSPHRERSRFHQVLHPHPKPKETKKRAFVSVGVSKLHLVELPDLVMKPIYWSPINDQASVIRATWFFESTMEPVDAELANRLEAGYEDMKPYSDVYKYELDSCVEHGASAELKIVHKLWPEEKKASRPPTSNGQLPQMEQSGPGDKEALLTSEVNAAADRRESYSRGPYATHSVIYVDHRHAQILRPSLLPSESRGRKPLASIRKGRSIGVPVLRGFDPQLWEKAHPGPKMTEKSAAAKVGGYMAQSGDATSRDKRASCSICDAEEKRPQPSHLVLVIHGIGQKLSERVDSYHFTHAVNGLRREFNVELASADVQSSLQDKSGIMVLPVNWRLNISFEDEEAKAKKAAASDNDYGLADITPDTLPAVRSLISDVMLDIPYYLSHHKAKMMSAVVTEANRVYRLWCRNNPGFRENGKVHLVAHSLGSVMAMDILSQQPTAVPKTLDLTNGPVSDSIFEFDTKSLFCCGSPSGFFLLLNNASLIPRKGRNKPGMEGEDSTPGVAGEAGTYGCLAVDNVYNICHKNDPIAYQQNACVDKVYAASLLPADVPSASTSMLARIGGSLRLTSPTVLNPYDSAAISSRPAMRQLPSTVELETHNFTREQIAERRMYLLNENGQIDFFLNSGGGPLEFQYINMLSAHSSYWILQDFVRFLVVEIGRQPGKSKTLPSLRAQKKRVYKRGDMK